MRAVAEASPLPATAKIRCRAAGDAEGLDVDVAATVALAERLVAAGAAAVCVHARTRARQDVREACWPAVRAVVAAVGAAVPVVANGGVRARRGRRGAAARDGLRGRHVGRGAARGPLALLRGAGAAARGGRGVPRVPRARGGRARLVGARAHVVAMLHAALARDADLREAVAAARTVAELAAALPDDAGPLRARDRAAPDAPAYAALLARGRAERRRAKDAAMRANAPPCARAAAAVGAPRRREPWPPSERQRRSPSRAANLRLCGCGEPAKPARRLRPVVLP